MAPDIQSFHDTDDTVKLWAASPASGGLLWGLPACTSCLLQLDTVDDVDVLLWCLCTLWWRSHQSPRILCIYLNTDKWDFLQGNWGPVRAPHYQYNLLAIDAVILEHASMARNASCRLWHKGFRYTCIVHRRLFLPQAL